MEMKIILNFVDLSDESANIIIDWIEGIVADKNSENMNPLRYVHTVEVKKET